MAVANGSRTHIRCPIHGFVSLDGWQREIIAQPAYQRLRRIRQLGMADATYPGALHSRFEHSLGVFHLATRLFDGIVARSGDRVAEHFGANADDFARMRRIVQAAALLHDIGHAPFSHVSEPLLPQSGGGLRAHEAYSAAIVRHRFADVIANHPDNRDFAITADEVADLLSGGSGDPVPGFWRGLVSGQMDADRMDYMLRDSCHLGVDYGRFDLERLLLKARAAEDLDGALVLGIEEGGWHAAEAMVLARYAIFTQVYFHRLTAVFEHHLRAVLDRILPGGSFPGNDAGSLEDYLAWDDWRVHGAIAAGEGGEDGWRIRNRCSFAQVRCTPEAAGDGDLQRIADAGAALGSLLAARLLAAKSSWHQPGPHDVTVFMDDGGCRNLSQISRPVGGLAPHRQVRLYVRPEDLETAQKVLATVPK